MAFSNNNLQCPVFQVEVVNAALVSVQQVSISQRGRELLAAETSISRHVAARALTTSGILPNFKIQHSPIGDQPHFSQLIFSHGAAMAIRSACILAAKVSCAESLILSA